MLVGTDVCFRSAGGNPPVWLGDRMTISKSDRWVSSGHTFMLMYPDRIVYGFEF